mmetsp:Transcript_26193/g.75642  ORF Transcript_26193/g.75642 Transcript_26193/m.75642 type:complete len:520 (-) Transcript_26193:40-1599(-)
MPVRGRRIVIGTLVAWTVAIALVVVLDDASSQHAKRLPEYLRPFRPVGIRVINAIGTLLCAVGLLDRAISLDPDYLLAAACSKLGRTYPKLHCVLRDAEDEQWHESFHRLTQALQHQAKLTMLGRVVAQGQIMGILEMRGRLLEEFAKEEGRFDSSSADLVDPIFIVGLPRTGTTLLSRLLAVDPANRAPTLWEYMSPVPKPPCPPPLNASAADFEAYDLKTKVRISEEHWKVNQYKSLAPGVDAMHPVEATNPEECIIIMNYIMDSEQVAVTYPIHEYLQWLLGFDNHVKALEWNRRVLQYLQQDDPYGPRRWVVKTPYYLAMMDDIRKVFPNAKIIHTHRDPAQSVLSVSSVIAKLHGIVTNDIDLHRIGSQQAEIHEIMVDEALQVRRRWAEEAENHGEEESNRSFRIIDMHLEDLQKDPIETVNNIYKSLFDAEVSPGAADLMRKWLEENPRTKHGTHRPTMDEFGLEGRMESDIFEAYRRAFGAKGAAPLPNDKDKGAGQEQAASNQDTEHGEL